jgi:hypothetical protein
MITVLLLLLASEVYGVPPELALGVGFVETRFQARLVGTSGELGVGQCMPYGRLTSLGGLHVSRQVERVYLQSELGGALESAARLAEWRRISTSWAESLCRYNAGTVCTERGKRYAEQVMHAAERFRRLMGGPVS